MAGKNDQMSFDDAAADLAATMNFPGSGAPLAKGGAAGDMPEGQVGAEGGFTGDAGGQVITTNVQGAVNKSGKTGAAMTSEPGAQNADRRTGAQMTSEPGSETGGGAGSGGNLSQDGDAAMRARKPGQVGVSGGSTGGGNLSENEDAAMRGRKDGKVGISKAEAAAMGLSKAQYDMLAERGLIKGCTTKSDDADMDDETDEDETEKGGVSANDLMKSLSTLEAVAAGSAIPTTEDRRAELAKGLEAGTLTQDEMVELADLMKAAVGDIDDPLDKSLDVDDRELEELEELDKSFQEQWAEAEADEGTYDVSPFLERVHQQTAAALDQIQSNLQKSIMAQGKNQTQFNIHLAKSLQGMARLAQGQEELIKSLAERLEVVENQPLPRRGAANVGQARVLQKSIPNEAGTVDQLSRGQILDALEDMALKSDNAPCGEQLTRAMALFESSGQLSKSLYQDITRHINHGTVH